VSSGMDQLYEIDKFAPIYFSSPDDRDYFSFLRHSVEQNFEAQNYHFSLVAMHMLYMGIVYHYIFWIYKADPKRFDHILIGFHDALKITSLDNISWHMFVNCGESNIFQFYRAVGIPKDQIGNLRQPVRVRNEMLHSNGKFLSSIGDYELKMNEYLLYLNKIHDHCKDEIKTLFFEFLDSVELKIETTEEAVGYLTQDLLQKYNMNLNTIKYLSKIGHTTYPGRPVNTKIIKDALVSIAD